MGGGEVSQASGGHTAETRKKMQHCSPQLRAVEVTIVLLAINLDSRVYILHSNLGTAAFSLPIHIILSISMAYCMVAKEQMFRDLGMLNISWIYISQTKDP